MTLLERELRARGLLDDKAVQEAEEAADRQAAALRDRMNEDPRLDPMELFTHVYARRTPQLRQQEDQLRAELAAEESAGRAGAGEETR